MPLIRMLLVGMLVLTAGRSYAADGSGCAHFTWNIARGGHLMRQAPEAAVAASGTQPSPPLLLLNRVYEVQLTGQSSVQYQLKPARPAREAAESGGLIRIHTKQEGKYRTLDGHWIDLVQGTRFIGSSDLQGAGDCDRVRNIVEFNLPADTDLTVQLSGAAGSSVLIAVTAVGAGG